MNKKYKSPGLGDKSDRHVLAGLLSGLNAKDRVVKKMPQPFQVSKEYLGGKFQKVGFYKNKKGDVDVRPMK